jgi:hypothetical protein
MAAPTTTQATAAQPQQATLREQFAASVAETKARWSAQQAAKRAATPQPAPTPVPVFNIEAARAELARLEASHSASYQFSDDRAEYHKGVDREQSINVLRAAIAEAERRAA